MFNVQKFQMFGLSYKTFAPRTLSWPHILFLESSTLTLSPQHRWRMIWGKEEELSKNIWRIIWGKEEFSKNISDEEEKGGPVEHMAISLLLGLLAARLIAGQFS